MTLFLLTSLGGFLRVLFRFEILTVLDLLLLFITFTDLHGRPLPRFKGSTVELAIGVVLCGTSFDDSNFGGRPRPRFMIMIGVAIEHTSFTVSLVSIDLSMGLALDLSDCT